MAPRERKAPSFASKNVGRYPCAGVVLALRLARAKRNIASGNRTLDGRRGDLGELVERDRRSSRAQARTVARGGADVIALATPCRIATSDGARHDAGDLLEALSDARRLVRVPVARWVAIWRRSDGMLLGIIVGRRRAKTGAIFREARALEMPR